MWAEYGYVISSKYRKLAVLALLNHPKIPTQISAEVNSPLGHISRALRELTAHKITTCINPKNVKGRMYALTKEGEKIAKQLSKNGGLHLSH